MKKVGFCFLFLMLIVMGSAMDEVVRVKTNPGNEVRLYAWVPGGSLLDSGKGVADDGGLFSMTFYFAREAYDLQVVVVDDEMNPRSEKIEGIMPSGNVDVDCRSSCVLASFGEIEVVEKVSEDDPSVVEAPVVEEVEENVSGEVEKVEDGNESVFFDDILFTGKAMFTKDDGSIDWFYVIIGIVILVVLVVLMFIVFKKKVPKKERVVLDDDERELMDVEQKVKDAQNKIIRKRKIEEAKKKLVEEMAELKRLESIAHPDVQEQRQIVQEAKRDFIEAKGDSSVVNNSVSQNNLNSVNNNLNSVNNNSVSG